MTTQFFKTVLAGILAGLALIMMPFFLIRMLIFFMLIGAAFRLMGFGKHRREMRYAFAQKYKNMSEDERKAFMQSYRGHGCCSPRMHDVPSTPVNEEAK